MPDQHLVESQAVSEGRRPLWFKSSGRGVRSLALTAVIAVGGAVHYAPSEDADETLTAAGADGASAHAVRSPIDAHPAARAGGPLSREQQNIAHFLAQRYRLALGQTQQFVEYAYHSAREVKVDPFLILAVASIESSFNPAAQSSRGAQGLMQVLTRVHKEKFTPFGGVHAAFDPLANMLVGAQILKGYLKRDGSVEAALKAYVGAALLPTDGGYGERVLAERERIVAAATGRETPERLVALARHEDAIRAQEAAARAQARAAAAARKEAEAQRPADTGSDRDRLPPYGRAQDAAFNEPVEIDRRADQVRSDLRPGSSIDG